MEDDLFGPVRRPRADLGYRVEQFEQVIDEFLGGNPFSTYWVSPDGFFVLEFRVEMRQLRPALVHAPGRKLRSSLRRVLLKYPELWDTRVSMVGTPYGIRYFYLSLPVRGCVENRVTLSAEAVEKWLRACRAGERSAR